MRGSDARLQGNGVLHFFRSSSRSPGVQVRDRARQADKCDGWLLRSTIARRTVSFLLIVSSCSRGLAATGKPCPRSCTQCPNLFARAAGQGHEKPFWYFGKLLIGGWSGGLLVALACLGLFHRTSKARCFALSVPRVLRITDRRDLQPDSLQDTVAGAQSLASAALIRCDGDRSLWQWATTGLAGALRFPPSASSQGCSAC